MLNKAAAIAVFLWACTVPALHAQTVDAAFAFGAPEFYEGDFDASLIDPYADATTYPGDELIYIDDGYVADDGYYDDTYVDDGWYDDTYVDDGWYDDGDYIDDGSYWDDTYLTDDTYIDDGWYVDDGLYIDDGYTDDYIDEGEYVEEDWWYVDDGTYFDDVQWVDADGDGIGDKVEVVLTDGEYLDPWWGETYWTLRGEAELGEYVIYATMMGDSPTAALPIPEPASITLLGLPALALLRRRH